MPFPTPVLPMVQRSGAIVILGSSGLTELHQEAIREAFHHPALDARKRLEKMKEHWSRKDFDTTSDVLLCKMWMRFCFLSLANKGSTTLRSAYCCPPFPLFLAFRFSATYQVHWLGGSSSKPFYCYIPQILFWTL